MYPNLLFSLVVAAVLNHGAVEGLRCWKCTSDSSPDCGDPFQADKYYSVDCSGRQDIDVRYSHSLPSQQLCRKLVEYDRDRPERVRVTRSCIWAHGDEDQCSQSALNTPSYRTVQHCSVCKDDDCNAGPTLRADFTLLAALIPLIAWSRR